MSETERNYKGWTIRGVGGFCTVRHFWATKGEEMAFWKFTLREAKATIDAIEIEPTEFSALNPLYRRPLYS